MWMTYKEYEYQLTGRLNIYKRFFGRGLKRASLRICLYVIYFYLGKKNKNVEWRKLYKPHTLLFSNDMRNYLRLNCYIFFLSYFSTGYFYLWTKTCGVGGATYKEKHFLCILSISWTVISVNFHPAKIFQSI